MGASFLVSALLVLQTTTAPSATNSAAVIAQAEALFRAYQARGQTDADKHAILEFFAGHDEALGSASSDRSPGRARVPDEVRRRAGRALLRAAARRLGS
jgi:hypothetical protein